jgi:hypothetical protein
MPSHRKSNDPHAWDNKTRPHRIAERDSRGGLIWFIWFVLFIWLS